MAKTIYMEQTLALIHSLNPEAVANIVHSGDIHQLNDGTKYLVITEEDITEQENK